MGQGKVIACQEHATSVADIFNQAKALWIAERPPDAQPAPGQPHSATWGCVAMLVRPNSQIPSSVFDEWARQMAQERGRPSGAKNYNPAAYNVKGRAAIDEHGILQIPWPDCCATGMPLDDFDVLLATATKPTPDPITKDFPTVANIAAAWNTKGDASYFHSNRKNGLHTFQDEELESLLHL
jgi:hypothetical protein